MKKLIYIEEEVRNNLRTQLICKKFKDPEIIYIKKYAEIFNKKNQNFSLQKRNPAIILAKKNNKLLLKTPENYGVGNNINYYFSYMYNCLFDCKYCFLQGLYSSANYVIFVNYEDYINEIKTIIKKNINKKITFFSGYDCDSLGFEPISNFMSYALNNFTDNPNFELEIRTKSTYLKPFLREVKNNIIIAYSFTPKRFSKSYEKGVPGFEKRIKTLKKLCDLDWKIGFRFDPVIIYEGWKEDYSKMFEILFSNIKRNSIHSVSVGNLRFPKSMYKKIIKNNSEEKIFFNLIKKNKLYEANNNNIVNKFCLDKLKDYIDKNKIYFNN